MTDEPEYRVGYGKPPLHTRFKPGEPSPNPSGRPKGARSVKADLDDELSQMVRVTENGKNVELTKQQLMMKSLVNKAIKGDTPAASKVLDIKRDTGGLGDDGSTNDAPLSADDQAILDAFLAKNRSSSTENDDG
jgi:hypothetical protein